MNGEIKRMTVEEFWTRYGDTPHELVRGQVVEVSPFYHWHGQTVAWVASLLGRFVEEHQLGDIVLANTGFRLSETTLLNPDLAFIRRAKVATIPDPDGYVPFAPDLAVEVMSPKEHVPVEDRVNLYLEAGSPMVWVLGLTSEVTIYQADHSSKTVSGAEQVDGGSILPGLSVAASDLFPPEEDVE